MTFERRPLRLADAADWVDLAARIGDHDGDGSHRTEDDFRESFEDSHRDPVRGTLGVFDDQALVGYATLQSRSEARASHDMRYDGGVHPGYRGRGIGGSLLAWGEAAAIPQHTERFPGTPLNLHSGCATANAAAAELHLSRGYRQVRVFQTMVRDLAEPVRQVPLAEGLTVVPYSPAVSADALLVKNEAFRDHWGAVDTSQENWSRMERSAAFRPEFSYVAYRDSAPLAILISRESGKQLYIGLVATRAEGRGRGIASALLSRVLAGARSAGYSTAALDVDSDSPTGAVGVYDRAGFRVTTSRNVYEKSLLR